jgi:hypothetical protein
MYAYGHTTVYRVRKWISMVGKEQLEVHLQDDPSLTLIAARQMYFQEWQDTKKGGGKDTNRPKRTHEAEGVEVGKPKKRKVNHDQTRNLNITEDSDVEIVGK